MSARTLVLFLPADPDTPIAWSLVADGVAMSAGDTVQAAPPPADDLHCHAVVAPEAVTLHRVALPDLAPNQARAAARLLAAEASAAPAATLHVAIGAIEAAGSRLIAVADAALTAQWLARADATGHDIRGLWPSPLLIEGDEAGAVAGDVGPFAVIRTRDGGHADDALGRIVLGDDPPRPASPLPLDAAIAAAPVDLRQGPFARRSRRVDWPTIRRIAMLAVVAGALVLATQLVLIGRYRLAASAAEARVATLTATTLPRGAGNGGDAGAALSARLARLEGPGGGLAGLVAPLLDVLQASPAIDMTRLDFREDGSLVIELSGPDAPQLSAAANALQARGLRVVPGESGAVDGRTRVSLTVTRR